MYPCLRFIAIRRVRGIPEIEKPLLRHKARQFRQHTETADAGIEYADVSLIFFFLIHPVSIIVPCHRVMGAGGKLTGYGGGLWRKEALLALEKKGLFAGSSSSGAR